jgi:hypothetical protein
MLVLVVLLAGALATDVEARGKKKRGKKASEVPAVPGGAVAHSGMLAGAALALRNFAIWRNAMPRALKKGEKDPGSPLVAKADLEATGAKDTKKMTWTAEVRPAGAAAIPLQGVEITQEGKDWDGQLAPGQKVTLEVYYKGTSSLAPGTKAKMALTLKSGAETITLESDEATVDRVE